MCSALLTIQLVSSEFENSRPVSRTTGRHFANGQSYDYPVTEKFYHAQITKRVDFAPDLWMFRIRSGGEFNFVPGQYATLGVQTNGKRVERPYSIASSPAEDEVEFFFELVPEGALTPLLHKLQPGDELLMRKVPKGKFSLDTSNGRKNHLLISTVTGVAPFVSYRPDLSARNGKKDVSMARTSFICSMAPAARVSSDT